MNANSISSGNCIYFSDFFGINEADVEDYGAINISLINDLPLFIDPFLLFNSEKDEYQTIHAEMIKYLLFLKEKSALYPTPPKGMLRLWYGFSEIKQTWLGFSLSGNAGRGLGSDFAQNLFTGLKSMFKDFGNEQIPRSPHMEKLCLISPLVGRDKISDFTTNFAKRYLLEYTAEFAANHLSPEQCSEFAINGVAFNYELEAWETGHYTLPTLNGDYVLLTPRDLLTREDTFINRPDMFRSLHLIAPSVTDSALRFALENYFEKILGKTNKEMPKSEKEREAVTLIQKHPDLIDYYLRYKEDNEEDATSISREMVREVTQLFNIQLRELATSLHEKTDFYSEPANSYDAAYRRVQFLKSVIEDMDGYRIFYVDGKPIKRESDLQVMYRLVWFASEYDVNREVNNGRGPVDFKISKGSRDATLVEFKLASNSKLKQNLANQVDIYKEASQTDRAIKVILFFTEQERKKVIDVLNELGLLGCKDIILIDATVDKPSASNVKLLKADVQFATE